MSPAKFMELLESIPALQAAVLKHAAAHDAGTAINFTGNARVAYNKALAEAAPAAGYPSVAAFKADLDPVARQTFPELAEAPFWQSLFGVKGHGKPGVPGMNAAESKRAKAAIAAEDAFIGAKDPLTGQRRGGAIEKPSVDRQVFGEAEGTAESQGAVRSAREAADEALRPQYTRKNKKGEDVTRRHNVKKEFDNAAARELRKEGLSSEEIEARMAEKETYKNEMEAARVNGLPYVPKSPGELAAERKARKVPHALLGSDDIGTFTKEGEIQQAIVGEPSEQAIDMIRRGADVPSSRYANDDRIIEALLGRKPVTVDADRAAVAQFEGAGRNAPGVRGEVITSAGLTPRDPAAGYVTRSERVKPIGQDQLFDPEQYRQLGGDPRFTRPAPEQPRLSVDELLQQLHGEAPGQQSIGLAMPEAAVVEDGIEGLVSALPVRGMRPGAPSARVPQGLSYNDKRDQLDALLQRLMQAE